METYQGVKFKYLKLKNQFEFDQQLDEINQLAYHFSQLGLTPVHPEGAYGNQSYRKSASSFIITKSGMTPEPDTKTDNYCEVVGYQEESTTFLTHGDAIPSSECFLHYDIYRDCPEVNVILHGHSTLLNDYADELSIPTTKTFYDYGTKELAQSALKMATEEKNFFILRDHGFVALGSSIKETGEIVFDYYCKLVNLLK